jgi:antitoxin MazE
MRAAIKRMGNSAAILLPKPILAHLQVSTGDVLDLDLQEGRVVLSPAERHPRDGWAEAARALSEGGEGELEWPDHDLAGDEDWTW